MFNKKLNSMGWTYSSVVQHLLNMYKALDSISTTGKKKSTLTLKSKQRETGVKWLGHNEKRTR
jgi:hypothetical protein